MRLWGQREWNRVFEVFWASDHLIFLYPYEGKEEGFKASLSRPSATSTSIATQMTPLRIPLPVGQENFTYAPSCSPVLGEQPSQINPIGVGPVARGGSTLRVEVSMEGFAEPVDMYLALYFPVLDPQNVYLAAASGGIQPVSVGIFPWKSNQSTSEPI
jgi:hypothetical protein